MYELLRLDNASKVYGEGGAVVTALAHCNLTVQAGEFVCVAGPSGSGKTTLLNLAGLIDAPTSGEVLLGGEATSSLSKAARAALRKEWVGFIFQSHNLIPVLSALENVEFGLMLRGVGKASRRRAAAEALARVGLADQLEKRPGEMSGGQRQRVGVARAVAFEPKMIIADEPTANLDSETGTALMELFKALNAEGTTLLFSSHDPVVTGAAGRLVVLHDGVVVSDGADGPG